ncbi:MAG: polysaccharide deacetylase family protein [Chitinispirillaceae bacterium]|nr:polysaccharide deacetylase family protein [Chitinispirillaceae bacterium]
MAFGNIHWKGPVGRRMVAFTFDDGPHPVHTPRLLEILDASSAKATFFMTGTNAAAHRELVRDVAARGHEIGCHSFDHCRTRTLLALPERQLREIRETNEIVEAITGKPVTLYRPPYGLVSPLLLPVCLKLSLKIVLWNINSYDFRREPCSIIVARVLKRLADGAILLFHDCHYSDATIDYSTTASVIERLLAQCSSAKLESVTVSRLLERRGVCP